MVKVLIPFTEPDGGERAVRRLLADNNGSDCEVELLAIVEPIEAATARQSISPSLSRELAREAASVWIARIAPLLAAASLPYHSEIAVGDPASEIERALRRDDADRILLPAQASQQRHQARPLTVVD